jgi:MraZ protein
MFFRGANNVTLDAKGRLAMPTRYRERIVERSNGHLVATIDRTDRCLLIYPLPDFEEIERQLNDLPALSAAARSLQRLMIGHATELELDSQGRMLIPPKLREYAGLNRDVMLVGQGVRFELWDEAQWEANREQWLKTDHNAEGLSAELSALRL